MTGTRRPDIRPLHRRRLLAAKIALPAKIALGAALLALTTVAACTSGTSNLSATSSAAASSGVEAVATQAPATSAATSTPGRFTFAFAGDVNFMDRTATRLARNPATAFGSAAAVLGRADLTMVNLETAITTSSAGKQVKEYNFRAPPTALTALRDGGVDVATMANNHGADYGKPGLKQTLAAIKASKFPIVGIGANAAQAYAPWKTTVNGVKVAVLAADQVQDETTLRYFTAGAHSAGVASAYSPRLLAAVRAAKKAGYVVIVYLHWGVELQTCPNDAQETLAKQLAKAGASAVIGTHPHVLQGGGWLPGGTYVEYSTGNYLWWMSYHNNQDDNGIFTLTFDHGKVVAGTFAPAHLNSTGVPVPATGAQKTRISTEWKADRSCTNLAARPPA